MKHGPISYLIRPSKMSINAEIIAQQAGFVKWFWYKSVKGESGALFKADIDSFTVKM